jgi:hypothetical protein
MSCYHLSCAALLEADFLDRRLPSHFVADAQFGVHGDAHGGEHTARQRHGRRKIAARGVRYPVWVQDKAALAAFLDEREVVVGM